MPRAMSPDLSDDNCINGCDHVVTNWVTLASLCYSLHIIARNHSLIVKFSAEKCLKISIHASSLPTLIIAVEKRHD